MVQMLTLVTAYASGFSFSVFMQLVPVSVDSIRIGVPLPFPLLDKNGLLLARKSFIVLTRQALEDMANRGNGLYMDVSVSDSHHRAYVGQLHDLVRDDKVLGEIANTQMDASKVTNRVEDTLPERTDWFDLQVQANTMLRDSLSPYFNDRLDRVFRILQSESVRNPDGALFALVHLSSTETLMYSATHAMLVSLMCILAAREVIGWSPEIETLLGKSALTMNIGMTELQDRLAQQREAPNANQRSIIERHSDRSAEMLAEVGVTNSMWLDAIREHHKPAPGPLGRKTPAQQLARLIQRADMFAARLAPRVSRAPVTPPSLAMQACYFDENREVDEAGAALIKAVGIYQPGSFVRLTNNEIGVVIRRGPNSTTPRVAVVVNRDGLPKMEPTVRDTIQREYKIVASVPHSEMRLKLSLEKMLPLTQPTPSDRPW